jgi:(p)ppGpp synthase/HD superfamily hydrolase
MEPDEYNYDRNNEAAKPLPTNISAKKYSNGFTNQGFIDQCREYAEKCHRNVNHQYDGCDYALHLKMAETVGLRFHTLISEQDIPYVFGAIWCHDVIEDTRQTYNDVINATHFLVGDIVYAVTNEKGKTRKERANDKYYGGIRNIEYASFVKLCDRIANVRYSKQHGSSMFEVYQKENEHFERMLFDKRYATMFDYLKDLLLKTTTNDH